MSVTPDDIAETLGVASPVDQSLTYAQWQRWINNALLLIQFGDGLHAGLGDPTLLNQDVLDLVVIEAVSAMVRRPDESTQVEIAVDDGRVSRTYQSGTGRVTILDQWWALLRPDGLDSGAFSVRPSYVPDPRYWLPRGPVW